jgi:hypothetical protein
MAMESGNMEVARKPCPTRHASGKPGNKNVFIRTHFRLAGSESGF